MKTLEWNKICCPVDFSEPARTGLRVAVDLCRRLGSELVLLHSTGVSKIAQELPPASDEAPLAALEEEARRLGAPRVTVAEVAGLPEVAIVDYAGANGVDLIVMGTHGRVDREQMLTGSVSAGVVRSAACPVLIVHPGWKE
jgi:nucleotide-binding universal stress UspA family protein